MGFLSFQLRVILLGDSLPRLLQKTSECPHQPIHGGNPAFPLAEQRGDSIEQFSLGRIAFERRGAYPEAVRWFSVYLAELPQGPLMGDAVGRLMEARQRAGDRTGARADAARYLQRFPEGPYAPEARAMLSE